jgi:hypothetical protein
MQHGWAELWGVMRRATTGNWLMGGKKNRDAVQAFALMYIQKLDD